ncbi:hypothetical protein [Myroides odoratimimus]|uniref:hypothetical protein n=1 Tax=Myroides odoratimimus TaxID=76832 RepID=UPI0031015644
MFKVINITNIDDVLTDIGEVVLRKYKKKKENSLMTSLNQCITEGTIDVKMLSKAWFPLIEDAKVFLSHSSADKDIVYKLSYYLEEVCKIKTFVDSMVWGYSDQLLKEVDNKYCYNLDTRTYSYERRNISTSNIHLILNNSLIRMIDTCELILFINTENSINITEKIDDKLSTRSPWIFTELEACRMLRITIPSHWRNRIKKANEGVRDVFFSKEDENKLNFKYDIDLENFPKIGYQSFINILTKGHSLDFLGDNLLVYIYTKIK